MWSEIRIMIYDQEMQSKIDIISKSSFSNYNEFYVRFLVKELNNIIKMILLK